MALIRNSQREVPAVLAVGKEAVTLIEGGVLEIILGRKTWWLCASFGGTVGGLFATLVYWFFLGCTLILVRFSIIFSDCLSCRFQC